MDITMCSLRKYGMMQEYRNGRGKAVREYTITNKYGRGVTRTLVAVHKKNPCKSGEMSDLHVGFTNSIEGDNHKNPIWSMSKVYRIR